MRLRPAWLLLGLSALALRADADWKKLAQRFPQAMMVVEDSRDSYDVAPDGKYLATSHYRATVLQEPGIEHLAKYGDSYYEQYDQVTVKRAVIIGPDGKETPVGPDNIKDLPMPANGPFYLQNVRLVLISFPQLQVGSTVEVDTETRRSAPPMDGTFSRLETLQIEHPVLRQSLTVTLPASMPLAWKAYRGSVESARKEQDGRVTYQWQVGEQPQLLSEPSMPPAQEVVPVLALSTIPAWKDVSRWFAGLSKEGQAMTPALERLVAEVTAGKAGREEKIQALYFWVARNIRYVETAFTGEKAGFKPASADQTLQRKYGVCRDKAELLVALLRSIGVDASNVLITSGVRRDVDIPGIQFNHAIVALREAGGGWRFLDPTAEDSRQYLPYSDQDKYALVCTDEGEDIRLTPLAPPADNRMDITLDTVLGADGSLGAKVVMEPTGIYDLVFRQYLNSMPPARREMFFSTVAGRIFPGATVTGLTLPDLDDLNAPVRMAFTLTARDQGVRAGDYLVFTTPGQGGRLDLLLGSMLAGASSPRRRYPLALSATVESRIRETVQLPAGYAVRSLPTDVDLRESGSALNRTCRPAAGALAYAETFSTSDIYYSGEAYQGLRRLLERRGRLRDGKVILMRQGGAQ
jgi:transglutaminase-like putative cysteine protease